MFILFYRPESPETFTGHYLFRTSFSDVSYITNHTLGLTFGALEAEVIAVQQYKGKTLNLNLRLYALNNTRTNNSDLFYL